MASGTSSVLGMFGQTLATRGSSVAVAPWPSTSTAPARSVRSLRRTYSRTATPPPSSRHGSGAGNNPTRSSATAEARHGSPIREHSRDRDAASPPRSHFQRASGTTGNEAYDSLQTQINELKDSNTALLEANRVAHGRFVALETEANKVSTSLRQFAESDEELETRIQTAFIKADRSLTAL